MFGHFTAMQLRDGATRGLDLHLHRLAAATTEVFDTELDTARVRELLRHALRDGTRTASVRVYVFGYEGEPSIMTVVRPPAPEQVGAQRLRSVPYLRPFPHVKHLGGFAQTHLARQARLAGFDEVVLTGPDGAISEGSITNIGFFDGQSVVWPDAPQLAGITQQLLERELPGRGVPVRRADVRLADLGDFDAAFVSNSQGISLVSQVDDVHFPVRPEQLATLTDAYDAVPWDTP